MNNPTEAGQFSSVTPKGVKIGVIAFPATAKTDFSESSLPKVPSVPRELKNPSTAIIIIRNFPALTIKPFNRSHV